MQFIPLKSNNIQQPGLNAPPPPPHTHIFVCTCIHIPEFTVHKMELYNKTDQRTLCKNTNLTYCPCIQCVLLARDCCFSKEKRHSSEARRSSPNHKLSGRDQCKHCTNHHAVYTFLHGVRGHLALLEDPEVCTVQALVQSRSCHVAGYLIQYKELYLIYCLFCSPAN